MKKGFTILELLIVLALITILTSSVITITLKYNNRYKNEVVLSKEDFYIKESLMYIENEIQNDTESVAIQDNTIELVRTDGIHKDYVEKNHENKLVIVYKQNDSYLSTNDIMKGVKNFQVSLNDNLVFVKIEGESGEKFERCFGINLRK